MFSLSKAISRHNPDKMKAHASEAMPIAFLAMHEQKSETNAEVTAIWEEVNIAILLKLVTYMSVPGEAQWRRSNIFVQAINYVFITCDIFFKYSNGKIKRCGKDYRQNSCKNRSNYLT